MGCEFSEKNLLRRAKQEHDGIIRDKDHTAGPAVVNQGKVFGACCKDMSEALTLPEQRFLYVQAGIGVLYLTVGDIKTDQDMGWFDQALSILWNVSANARTSNAQPAEARWDLDAATRTDVYRAYRAGAGWPHLYRADQCAVHVPTRRQGSEFGAGLAYVIEHGWLMRHESGTYVRLPPAVNGLL